MDANGNGRIDGKRIGGITHRSGPGRIDGKRSKIDDITPPSRHGWIDGKRIGGITPRSGTRIPIYIAEEFCISPEKIAAAVDRLRPAPPPSYYSNPRTESVEDFLKRVSGQDDDKQQTNTVNSTSARIDQDIHRQVDIDVSIQDIR